MERGAIHSLTWKFLTIQLAVEDLSEIFPEEKVLKASLSLALGLSDTVSMNLGGIQMDALLVDEGFGTLDRKSMETAMDILINLSGTSKLVGIISHREELMENIPQQIRVKKTKDGSQLTIETGL